MMTPNDAGEGGGMISSGVDEFLEAVRPLTGVDIGAIRVAVIEVGPPARKDARRALKLSASEKSMLEKRARDVVRQMDLTGGVAGVGADAVSSVLSAVNAIASRHSLTAAQYAALTGPFAVVGVSVPPFDGVEEPRGGLTPREAEQALRAHFGEHPPRLNGELYFTGAWSEDDDDYLLTWGSREFLVEGREAFARWDNLAYFVDRRTGAVRAELFTASFRKIKKMTKHEADELGAE